MVSIDIQTEIRPQMNAMTYGTQSAAAHGKAS